MAEFYRLPNWALTALVMALALCIVLQTLAISYSIRRLPAGWARRLENGMECAVLAVLFIFAALLAQVAVCALLWLSGARRLWSGAAGRIPAHSGAGRLSGGVSGARLAVFRRRRGRQSLLPVAELIMGKNVSLLFSCRYFVFPAAQRAHLPDAPPGAQDPALLHIRQGGPSTACTRGCCSTARRETSCCATAGWTRWQGR